MLKRDQSGKKLDAGNLLDGHAGQEKARRDWGRSGLSLVDQG
jgi:hypothetical protein